MTEQESLFVKSPYAKPILILGIVFFIILFINDNSSIFSFWPYLLMSVSILIIYEIKDKKWAGISVLILMLILFGALSWFYYIIPISNNYKPIPLDGLGSIYNMGGGEYKIGYYPDYLKAGDTVLLTAEICTSNSICQKCDNCTFDGYFINEEGRKQQIFMNESIKNKSNIQYMFTGYQTEITMKNNMQSFTFYVPKPSLYQSFLIATEQNPYVVIASFISGILGLPLLIISICVKRKEIFSYFIKFYRDKKKLITKYIK